MRGVLRGVLRRLRRSGSGSDRGSMAVELVAFVPIIALVTLIVVQGFLAVTAVSSAQDAARDGARAASLGRSVDDAVHAQLPDWIRLERLERWGCGGECVSVEVRIPIGVPGVTTSSVTVTRTAELPRG